jgi:orotate phosphoribosyltransferase
MGNLLLSLPETFGIGDPAICRPPVVASPNPQIIGILALSMPVDLLRRLTETGALLHGHFRLSSGLHSPLYVQCARLLEHPRDARAIGAALAEKIRPFRPDLVVAPALGGLIIGYSVAEALELPMIFTERNERKEGTMSLRRGFAVGDRRRVVVVEDVVTTGKSSLEAAAVVEDEGAEIVGFASILNRSGRDNPFEGNSFVSLMTMTIDTYAESDCPLCGKGIPLDTPGSRFAAAR